MESPEQSASELRPVAKDSEVFSGLCKPNLIELAMSKSSLASPSARHSLAVLAASNHLASSTETVGSASLSEFLAETGVRFLENISSLKRRETTGRPRDSDIVTPSRQAHIATALLPQTDFFEDATVDLVSSILEIKEALAKQEGQFSCQPPMAYLQYHRDIANRPHLLNRMKTLKSISRLLSKHSWHKWRLARQMHVVGQLESNSSTLRSVWDPLAEADRHLDALVHQVLEPRYRELDTEYSTLEHCRSFPDEVDQARQMEQLVAEQEASIKAMDAELLELEATEARLKAAIQATMEQQEALRVKIEREKAACEGTPEITELVLEELRSLMALDRAVGGWEFVTVRPDAFTIRYLPYGPILIHFDVDPATGLVKGIKVDGVRAKAPFCRLASRLYSSDGFAGKPLAPSLLQACLQLDRLHMFTKYLDGLSLQCNYECIEDPAAAFTGIPLALSFFSYEARSKFDLRLIIGSNSVQALPTNDEDLATCFVHYYGPIGWGDVKDLLGLALSSTHARSPLHQPLVLKALAGSIHRMLEEKAIEGRPSEAHSLHLLTLSSTPSGPD